MLSAVKLHWRSLRVPRFSISLSERGDFGAGRRGFAIGHMMSLRQWHRRLHLRERTEQRRISLRRPSLKVGMPGMDSARGKGTGSASSEHLNARSVTPARDKNSQTPAFHHEPRRGMSAKASHCSNPTVILVRSVLSSSTVCNTTARWIVRFSDLVVILPERRCGKPSQI